MLWLTSVVIGRVLVEPGLPPPDVADEAVLFVKRRNVVVGENCPPGDAGVDAGSLDAMLPDAALLDAALPDAASGDGGLGDGGVSDTGLDGGTGCTTTLPDAVSMIVRPRVTTTTAGARFAIFYVTPARPFVGTTTDVFYQLADLTAPLIRHETVEIEDRRLACEDGCGGGPYGGCDYSYDGGDYWEPPGAGSGDFGDGGLVVEMAGPYQFIRAQPTDASELAGWLDQLGYDYTQADLDAVAPYVALGWHVTAVRIAIEKASDANLVPISLTWAGTEIRIPAALGRATGIGTWPLTVYIAAEGRYELPNANVPYAMRTSFSNMGFLTQNQIKIDQDKPPSADPIAVKVTDVEYHFTKVETDYVHVPPRCDDGGCCRDCNARPNVRLDWGILALVVAFVVGRKRRRRRA